MIGLLAAALLVTAAVALEIALPAQDVYHTGWYNVLLSALVIVTVVAGRKAFRSARTMRARLSILALAFGAAATGLAGVASGLLGPDTQQVVGAPGARIRVENLGVLVFPLAAADQPTAASVRLEPALRAPFQIDARPRDAGNFILHTSPRDVVYVEAHDAHGSRLTITQPAGSTFLSPVLLMEQRQTIAGLDLPYDSFNLPAVRRVVKAVLFTPAQAAMLVHGPRDPGAPAVLFAVDDENEQPLPHGVALSSGGRTVYVGGLALRAMVAQYPAVTVVAAPNIIAVTIGTLLVLGGLVALIPIEA